MGLCMGVSLSLYLCFGVGEFVEMCVCVPGCGCVSLSVGV